MMYASLSTDSIGFPVRMDEAIPLIAKYGFRGANFNDLKRDMVCPAEKMKALLEEYDLLPSSFRMAMEFRDSDELFERDFIEYQQVIQYAQALGITLCNNSVRPFSEELTYLQNFKRYTYRLKKITDMLDSYGMSMALEFIGPVPVRLRAKYDFIHTLGEMLELMDAIDSKNVKLVVDSYHWYTAKQSDEDFKLLNKDNIGLVHINDAPAGIPREQQEDLVRCMPGETGVIDIATFLDAIRKTGYDGAVMAEPFCGWLEKLALEDAIRETAVSFKTVGLL